LLGGLLSSAGHDVTLYGRGPSIEAIQDRGLSVTLHDRQRTSHPAAVSSLEGDAEPYDVVLLTVRSFAVAAALDSLRPLLEQGTVLVTLQNGIGTEELITSELPGV
jgi:2-dehydropantoate 2-reductase